MEKTPKYTRAVKKQNLREQKTPEHIANQEKLRESRFQIQQEIKNSTITAKISSAEALKDIETHIANLSNKLLVMNGEIDTDSGDELNEVDAIQEDFKEAINPKHIIQFREKTLSILEEIRQEYQGTLRHIFTDMEESQEDYSTQIEEITDAIDDLKAIEQRLFKAKTEHDIQLAQVGLEVQEKKMKELCINPRKYREIVNNLTNQNSKEFMRTKVIKLFEETLDLLSAKTDDELDETLGVFISLQSKEEEMLKIIDPNPKNITLDQKKLTVRSLSEIMIKAMMFQNRDISEIAQNKFSTESINQNEWRDYFSEQDIVYMLTNINERQLKTIIEGL
jgi:hypothetical protein